MIFRFVVEDCYGPDFIMRLFNKKRKEGLFSGSLKGVRSCLIGNKLRRIVNAALLDAKHVIVLMDADGKPLDQKTEEIKQYLDARYLDYISIVLLDYEIEEWICYSKNIPTKGAKPSSVLKRHNNYRKRCLPGFAEELDCKRLVGCPSFRRLVDVLESA